jgi:glycosyltransferase involved in cell wall biosynthesis
MSTSGEPLVSIVTPVYNGEAYLAECVESVLNQTYSNWEYIIVDNFSTDRTPEIVARYAQQCQRISVFRNHKLLPIIANHNRAFRLISPESKYCKVVSGDDWIYPECIARMVQVAEANPSIGVVGSYQLTGGGDKWYVRTFGLPYSSVCISGNYIARAHLLGTLDVLGDPTSSLYRSDLVRRTDSFFPNQTAEADVSAIYECLKCSDFGFVHQVLSHERIHPAQITNTSKSFDAFFSSKLGDVHTYGPFFLASDEIEKRTNELMDKYYDTLAFSAVHFREKTYWDYHRRRLSEIGRPFSNIRLARAVSARILGLLLNPGETSQKFLRRLTSN